MISFLLFVWVLVMLYPDPGILVRSIRNISEARADAPAASGLAAGMPSDPRVIERYVLSFPYENDWSTAGVPWYFPTAAEALEAKRGDCESRAVALASLLSAKGIPNELRVALNHIWVDYPGKYPSVMENIELEVAGHRKSGFFLQIPGQFDLEKVIADQIDITWATMPVSRLLPLLMGALLIVTINRWSAWFGGEAARHRAGTAVGQPVADAKRRWRGLLIAALSWSTRR